ncbi:hypothetical protein ACLOJK_001910 [Asimina triloba]
MEAEIELTPLTTFPTVLSFDESCVWSEYSALSVTTGEVYESSKRGMWEYFIRKAVVSPDTTSDLDFNVGRGSMWSVVATRVSSTWKIKSITPLPCPGRSRMKLHICPHPYGFSPLAVSMNYIKNGGGCAPAISINFRIMGIDNQVSLKFGLTVSKCMMLKSWMLISLCRRMPKNACQNRAERVWRRTDPFNVLSLVGWECTVISLRKENYGVV